MYCTVRRVLYGTRIFSWNDGDLVKHLHSVLYRMQSAAITLPLGLLDRSRCYREVHEDGATKWCKIKINQVRLLGFELVDGTYKVFRLLQDYGHGRDGHVWLAVSQANDILCVIKFPTSQGKEELAHVLSPVEHERDRWNDIYGPNTARVVTLSGKKALLMPFAFHFVSHALPTTTSSTAVTSSSIVSSTSSTVPSTSPTASDTVSICGHFSYPDHNDQTNQGGDHYFADDDVNQVKLAELIRDATNNIKTIAIEAIETIANAGYHHNDVEWRHVAFIVRRNSHGKLERKSILIDLADMSRIGDQDKEKVIAAMKLKLGI
jgi:hypothetical protein